ncbi:MULTISPECIES: pyridoxamine 5'-phosphate oxidase family protein [unclassified Motilimonas]|uniref:pyridoxamine 5'-phosphate oxidase family protein n=1 Tax=Motilimonas TaxID=1914248 RepID=UPI001E644204|nr:MULTISPECIES: pyridoxamine 5'-phosphate oxidase family protein [unclassified Motilimonas]MCE0555539.1 pyridoxamine 5'-phosphate oxidase family protein [Motilimonas sp. E26]MDO6526923.1 pyridoxamine 5'-phosphate oxidase family protein [Motilimonas sp. 1_MG-2023]
MGQQFTELQDKHSDFIAQQQMFFVGTAAEQGRVNVSPKGADSFRVVNKNQVIWLNLTGSGNETSAHVQINPRMTIMFCAFAGAPIILRLYGQAQVLHRNDPLWQSYISLFPASIAARQLYLLDIDLVQSSCGMSVPLFDFKQQRTALADWSEKQGEQGIEAYWLKKNQQSIDGFDTNIANLAGLAHKQ